jgi:hypothetical protein
MNTRSRRIHQICLAALLATALTAGCADGFGPRGETCGGAQIASARATLPDTGIGDGASVSIVLSQRDPFLIGELADFAVFHLWPESKGTNPEIDPRVRIVRDDGRVLLDTIATRRIPNDGSPNRRTWIVFRTFSDPELRSAIFEAMRTESIRLELWHPTGAAPGTVVRPRTEEAFVSAIATCL